MSNNIQNIVQNQADAYAYVARKERNRSGCLQFLKVWLIVTLLAMASIIVIVAIAAH